MPTQTFPATPAQLDHLRAELATNGVTVPAGDSGQITGRGITADFTYDGSSGLVVTIRSKPWYLPAATIFADIKNALA